MKSILTIVSILFMLSSSTFSQVVHLKFEGNLDGESGTQINGTANGTFQYVDGLDGKSLKVDGSSSKPFVSLGNPSSLAFDENDDFTVQIWVKTNLDASKNAVLISNSDLSEKQSPIHSKHGLVKLNKGWSLYLREGTWGFNVGDGYKNFMYEPFPGTQVVNDNEWHQFVFSHKDNENSMRVYLDGRKRAIINITNLSRGFGVNSETNICVDGRGSSSHYDAYNGLIDNVIIWDKTLTDEEVANQFSEFRDFQLTIPMNKRQNQLVAIAWNIWHGGSHYTYDSHGWDGAERTAEIIKELDPDFIMMQETYGSGGKIASILDYDLMLAGSCWSATWGSNISVMSRYPMKRGYMTNNLPEYNGGALIKVSNDQDVLVFSNWYSRDRPQQIGQVLNGWTEMINNADEIPIIWGGDYNSPSHLDGNSGTHSKQMTDAGFKDSFRELNDAENRIDYLYYKGKDLTPTYSDMLRNSDFDRYPSDHPIVYTEFAVDFPVNNSPAIEHSANQKIGTYNPSNKELVFSFNSKMQDIKSVYVFNMHGQKVFSSSRNYNDIKMTIPFVNLSNGMYLVYLNSGKEKNMFKVLVQ